MLVEYRRRAITNAYIQRTIFVGTNGPNIIFTRMRENLNHKYKYLMNTELDLLKLLEQI